ncbi:metal ABC transporter solute-binding protein, Zn/Mn family [Psychromonas antarctica]|uniref:metal ABC transporter solute-binding protein, Zn/Mn family n=1 Tax=Psychromonas antarctica TaxID=67573 RepID=UPI001EE89C28|nr:zinc ABC transporter substrate-binding protein [Psychromonas antarctica]MCG6201893.1 zinc ABC transporter substrate-binding protein [Psychromonas antarctica]
MTFKITKKAYLIASIALGLGVNTTAFANDKIPVVASFSILGDLVSEVGGSHIDITTLVKANGDAHVYSPTPKDALAIRKAKLLIVNGLNFEGWMPRILESAHFQGTTIVASDGINVITLGDDEHEDHADHDEKHHEDADHDEKHEDHADHDEMHHEDADHDEKHEDHADHDEMHHEDTDHDEKHEEHASEHHHDGVDPHAWNSIINVKTYVKNIASGLSQVDPENANDYQQNAQGYLQKLDKLEIKLHAKLDTIPLSQRKLITPHDAFAYFARDFKIEFIAPQGTSTESEASASDMAAIIKQIRKDKVGAVFMENIADNRIIEQISQETDAKIGGELFSGSLSDKQGPASTYLKMIEYNVNTIVSALTK